MSSPPPLWLVNSFSDTLKPLQQNADKHTIIIKQIIENESQRNTQQFYILHLVTETKFTVETYFSYPVYTPELKPNADTSLPVPTPFVTVYDSNTANGSKEHVAYALANFSYNSFLSGDGDAGKSGKYIVEIRDFISTKLYGTTATYSPPCLQTGYTCTSPGTCSNCCSGAYSFDIENDDYVYPSNLNNNIIEYIVTTKDEVPKIVYQQRHVGYFTSDKRISIHSEVTSLTEKLYGATDTSSDSTEGIEAYKLGFTEVVYNQMKEYYTVENNFVNAIITYGHKVSIPPSNWNGRGCDPYANNPKCIPCYSVGIGGFGGYYNLCCYTKQLPDDPIAPVVGYNCPLSCCVDESCCPEGKCYNYGTVCCAKGTIYCGGTCQTGTTCCNGTTCPGTYSQCVNNTCYPPDKYPCNGQVYDVPAGALGYCCNNKFVVTYDGFPISCCGDTACTIENPVCCGGNCYAYGSTCCGNTVCTIENPVCCGGECFPPGTYCCNNVVCGTGYACCNNQCYSIFTEEYPFDPGFCCEGTWCPAPNICDNGCRSTM